jgi:hypothetical protein
MILSEKVSFTEENKAAVKAWMGKANPKLVVRKLT